MLGFAPLSTFPVSTAPLQDKVSASVSANATVFLDAIRFAFDAASVAGTSAVNLDATRFRLGVSSIDALATISAQAYVQYSFVADIEGVASVNSLANARFLMSGDSQVVASIDLTVRKTMIIVATANANAQINVAQPSAIFTFVSDINGIAVADLTPNIIASAGANINGNAQYLIDAELVGENWSVVPQGTNLWLRRG